MGVEWPMLPVLWVQGHVPSSSHSVTLSRPLLKVQKPLLITLSLSSSRGVEGAPQIHEKLHTQQAQGRTSIRRASGQLPRLEAEMIDAQSL